MRAIFLLSLLRVPYALNFNAISACYTSFSLALPPCYKSGVGGGVHHSAGIPGFADSKTKTCSCCPSLSQAYVSAKRGIGVGTRTRFVVSTTSPFGFPQIMPAIPSRLLVGVCYLHPPVSSARFLFSWTAYLYMVSSAMPACAPPLSGLGSSCRVCDLQHATARDNAFSLYYAGLITYFLFDTRVVLPPFFASCLRA